MTAADEIAAITRAIQFYVDGARNGSSTTMREAFHEGATIFGYENGELFSGPIQRLFDWLDQNGPASALQAKLTQIDVVETIATVRLELENWTGTNYTDLFTLLKVGTGWKITNKVFHIRP